MKVKNRIGTVMPTTTHEMEQEDNSQLDRKPISSLLIIVLIRFRT